MQHDVLRRRAEVLRTKSMVRRRHLRTQHRGADLPDWTRMGARFRTDRLCAARTFRKPQFRVACLFSSVRLAAGAADDRADYLEILLPIYLLLLHANKLYLYVCGDGDFRFESVVRCA